ncbi:Beta-lactamase-like protein [Penicillium verhagenii]|uniref:Beta-lactamase-like protein n=1 Tax=Penicillium verhagenii TaxID=1562060 RepID=UPI0025451240|nr:Beta-lactamase-like protein [Penicillium verhagenii]KAJ5936845.1 Beta-lactamase-like protein [Penicillium verhagenii]
MGLSLTLIFLWLLFYGAVALQKPLQVYEHHSRGLPLDDSFDEKVDWVREHFKIPGLAVAVVREETYTKVSHPVFQKSSLHRCLMLEIDEKNQQGYGFSDIISSQPVTEHTLFFTGSTTKAFTAAAISLLVDDELNFPSINWNTPVHSILPEDFVLSDPWSTSQMTIIDILSHRSGLPRHDWVWLSNITLKEAVHSMRDLPFTASPRTEWQYCNLMYMAASHLIETVTNQSLESFLMENIWLPLNMTETYLSVSEAQKAHSDISQGYYVNLEGEFASSERTFIHTLRGAGNVLSSVSDYAKWISTLLNQEPPFSQQSYAKLFGGHSIVSPNAVEPFQTPTLYGLGWMSAAYQGEMMVFHGGSQIGYGASVMLLPQRKFGLVLLGNNMDGVSVAADVLAYHLIDEELGVPLKDRFDWVTRGDALINQTHLSENILSELYPTIPDPPFPSPVNFSAYEGSYTHPAYPEFKISSNCTGDERVYKRLNWTTPDLCAILPRHNDYSIDTKLYFFHVSGTFWYQIGLSWDVPTPSRVEFEIGPDGSVTRLGIEIEPTMAEQREKIWWKHVY